MWGGLWEIATVWGSLLKNKIKWRLLLGSKVMTNLDSIFKSRDITLPTKAKELMLLNCGVGEDSWESLGLQGDPTSPSWKISPGISLEGMILKLKLQYFGHLMQRADSLEKLWCWEGLRTGEGDDRDGDDRDGWMASPTRWTWVCVNSGSWWWTGRPGVLQFVGSQRVGHDWATELNWALTGSLC